MEWRVRRIGGRLRFRLRGWLRGRGREGRAVRYRARRAWLRTCGGRSALSPCNCAVWARRRWVSGSLGSDFWRGRRRGVRDCGHRSRWRSCRMEMASRPWRSRRRCDDVADGGRAFPDAADDAPGGDGGGDDEAQDDNGAEDAGFDDVALPVEVSVPGRSASQ